MLGVILIDGESQCRSEGPGRKKQTANLSFRSLRNGCSCRWLWFTTLV